MKNTCVYRYLAVASAVIVSMISCSRIEEQEIPDAAPKVHMTFSAEIEAKADTKTALGGNIGDEFRKVLWEPGDSIGVSSHSSGGAMDKFVNTKEQLSAVGTFEGSTNEGSEYYMLYPYSSSVKTDNGNIYFNLSSSQTYKKDSFASDAMPMFAKGSPGNKYRFYSLCGVFAINLTGSETVTSVSFSGKDASGNYLPVSGDFIVSTNYEEYPEAVSGENKGNSVSLICNEGVVLNPSVPTSFYIVLPVATYESFTIMISTADGKMMLKEVNKTLVIKRSNVTQTASLAYVASSDVFNLSDSGWANCYVVSKPGLYSFDATVIGNGDFGIIEDADFHATSATIAPASAELVWEDVPGVITAPVYDGKRINFMASGFEGNALVAAKDAEGTIIWSWHIWVTDKPEEQIYVNSLGTFTVLDRNLGATRSDRGAGDEWLDSRGLVYFWGRKDPFWYGAYDHILGALTLEDAISNPNKCHKLDSWTGGQTSWMGTNKPYLWTKRKKTIYDPCPLGYRVACYDVWQGFTVTEQPSNIVSEFNVKGSFDNGWEFYIDESKTGTAWYPASYMFGWNGTHDMNPYQGAVWTSDYRSNSHKFYFYYDSGMLLINSYLSDDGKAYSVRCMKDDGYVDMSIPVVEVVGFRDVTETSVKVVANVKHTGASEIADRGVIWSVSEDFSNAVKVSAGSGSGEFSCDLTGLESGSIYYVKAYAVNDHGESYTDVRVFSTRYSDENAVDLSKYETANTYIVSSPGRYIINCLVKGNSLESVGIPASAEVVWETRNTDAPVTTGDIITALEFHGGYLSFEVPSTFTQGNALVAVKDASGNILWSWHIWVTDFDPDITVQTYISGAKMMDRNLGALDAGTTSTAYGFLYQWGRKDPLITSATGESEFAVTAPADVRTHVSSVSGDMLEYTIKNPTHTVQGLRNPGGTWNREKTMYDPCPSGWRVPDGGPEGVWSGIYWEGIEKDRGASTYWQITEQYSTPVAVYPAPGYTGGNTYELSFPGSALYCWSCTQVNEFDAYGMHLFDRIERELTSGKASEFSVRCQMMESDYSAEITYMVSESQSSVTVRGKVSIVRDCKIDEKGVVYSTTNSLPTIDNNDGKVKSDSTDAGEFECIINGIKRQTKYYIRPYVSGDKGVKYGKVMEYIERTPGSGEGFTGDDFEW